jgi:hypothetical protein
VEEEIAGGGPSKGESLRCPCGALARQSNAVKWVESQFERGKLDLHWNIGSLCESLQTYTNCAVVANLS